jgi:hypothetical protein
MKRFILAVTILFSTLFMGATVTPAYVAADAKSEICKGVGAASGSGGCVNDGSLSRVVRVIINLFSVIIGIVAVIMIMVAGFKYVTANGDSGNLSSAKNTLIYAIVGLVIVALAQFIVKFVLDKVL